MLEFAESAIAWWQGLSDYTQFAILWVVIACALLSGLWVPALVREYRYRRWCGMTCRGGSECRRCPCRSPRECRMQHGFDHRAMEVRDRLARLDRRPQLMPRRPVN